MKKAIQYRGHRFSPEVIITAVWLYHRFSLSFRNVEDLMGYRGVMVSYESIRRWCLKFGSQYQRVLKRCKRKGSDQWFADEMYLQINDEQLYLWRAIDQDEDFLDTLVQRRRNRAGTGRFFRKGLQRQDRASRVIVTDKLASHPPAVRAILPDAKHNTQWYANNRAENSHQATRRHGRQMQRFKSVQQAQRFLSLHARVNNLFRYGRHLISSVNDRTLRDREFLTWSRITRV